MPDLDHSAYLSYVVKSLKEVSETDTDVSERLMQSAEKVSALVSLDLEPARVVLQEGYANRIGGKPPHDCVTMFRSIVMMLLWGEVSFNRWAKKLRGQIELRILAGFVNGESPGVATLYDFANRLLDGPYKKPSESAYRSSRRFKGNRGRFRRNLGEEKATRKALSDDLLAEQNEQKVEYLVRMALPKLKDPLLPKDFQNRIEELLMTCAVLPSAELGLLGDMSKLTVSGDGSSLPSHANGNGHSRCSCRQEGIRSCGCDRVYADLEATWGWDSYRELYFFGYRLHLLATKHGPYELPLHIMVAPAHNVDCVLAVEAVTRFDKLLRAANEDWRVRNWLFDKGYDVTAFYRLLCELDGRPVIPLRNTGSTPVDNDNIARDQQGRPLCKGNIPMRLHQKDEHAGKTSHCCPAKYLGRTNGKPEYKVDMERCPLGALCEPQSSLGPYIHLYSKHNYRLNTEVVRGSEEYEELYKQRTCPERLFSQQESVGLKQDAYRRCHLFYLSTLAFCLGVHAKAWVKHRREQRKEKAPTTCRELLSLLETMLAERTVQMNT